MGLMHPSDPFGFDPTPQQPHLEDALNDKQLEAVRAGAGPILVIAGAGSGKTRVLVHRVAHLVSEGVAPSSILLLTFTRRAADEMVRRASALLGGRCDRVAGGTFHSFAHTLLRQHGERIGLPSGFSILDQADSEAIIGQMRSKLGLGTREQRFPKRRTCLSMISASINRGLELSEVVLNSWPHFSEHVPALTRLYKAYRDYKLEHYLVDFDDLLLYTRALLQDEIEVRQQLADDYRYILVDEYQDTNRIQGEIVRLLAGDNANITVVGDDAQSIYRFRGATVENILGFPKQFEGVRQITLEQNYRSTQSILDVANSILEASDLGYPKHLTSNISGSTRPKLVACEDERTQSRYVVQRIEELQAEGVPLGSMAVLFRSSFHAFDLELELNRKDIPYVKFGGFRFNETAHVKDLIAHLRVVDNPNDAVSWQRILTLLPGIGAGTAGKIIEGRSEEAPLDISGTKVPRRSTDSITRLQDLLRRIGQEGLPPETLIEEALDYYDPILRERFDDYPKRRADLEQLAVIAAGRPELRQMLADLAIEPPNRSLEDGKMHTEPADDSRLVLSTIHSAKGLEWEAVFVLWTLEGRFPSFQALDDPEEIEEERRLLYVAVTRARADLTLTYPVAVWDRQGRYLSEVSSLVAPIPADILEPIRARAGYGTGPVRIVPMRLSRVSPQETSYQPMGDAAPSRLRTKRERMDRRILGHLSDDNIRYEVDPDFIDE